MNQNPISDMLRSTLEKVRELVDADTIIGTPITFSEDVTVVPVSQVSIGLAGGGSDFGKEPSRVHFGGGSGAGISVKPVSFIVYEKGSIRMMPVSGGGEANPYVQAVDAVPVAAERIVGLIRDLKKNKPQEE